MQWTTRCSIRGCWLLPCTLVVLLFIRFRILPGGWEECGVLPPAMTCGEMGWQLWPDLSEPEIWQGPARTSVQWLVLLGYPVYFLTEGLVILLVHRMADCPRRTVFLTIPVFLTMRFIQWHIVFLPFGTVLSIEPDIRLLASSCPLWVLLLPTLLAGRCSARSFNPFSTFFNGP